MPTKPPRSTTPEYGPCRFCGASFLIYTPGQRGRIADFCGDDCRSLSAALDALDNGTSFLNGRPNAKNIRARLLAAVNGIHAGVVQAQAERKQKKEEAQKEAVVEQARRDEAAAAERAKAALLAEQRETERLAQEAELAKQEAKEEEGRAAYKTSVFQARAEGSIFYIETLSASGRWLVLFGKNTLLEARLMVQATPVSIRLRIVESATGRVIPPTV